MLQWQPELLHWFIFSVVVWGERLLPLPFYLHPVSAFRALAQRMAKRVHPSTERSRSQQRISGLMATLVLLLPWLVIVALIYWIAQAAWLFAALVLYFSLHSNIALRNFNRLTSAAKAGHKQLARDILQPYLVYETSNLSPIGFNKAAIEWFTLYWVRSWLGTIFWFLVAGPIAALAYRLILELASVWPVERRHWRDFGAPVTAFAQALSWPAMFIMWLLLAFRQLLSGKVLPWSFRSEPCMTPAIGRLLRSVALRLNCRLGGPVMLNQQKQQRSRFQYGTEPTSTHLNQTANLILRVQIAVWLLSSPLFLTTLTTL